jgi:aminoglycoside 6'-N-acetyltransferase I
LRGKKKQRFLLSFVAGNTLPPRKSEQSAIAMSTIHIRIAHPLDRPSLARLFHALWPKGPAEEHSQELEAILSGKPPGTLPLVVFVAEANDRSLLGFIEVGLRSHADSCNPALPVGYVEGWYVAQAHRRRGVGKQLMAAAEDWARSRGCVEMASDTHIDNKLSERAHRSLGYQAVERAILFRKTLR